MRSPLTSLLTRVAAIVGGLVVIGIVLKLLGAVLEPVLPVWASESLVAGWAMLYSSLGPAVPAICAGLILFALLWVFTGRR